MFGEIQRLPGTPNCCALFFLKIAKKTSPSLDTRLSGAKQNLMR